MKKLIAVLMLASMLLAMLLPGVTATAAEEKEFTVDGNLDKWYLWNGEESLEDPNYYHYDELSYISKSNGVDYYSGDHVTFGQVWTAYDTKYVYVYAKIWDENIIAWDPDGIHAGDNSSAADSVEIWFDPDPNSQTHNQDGTERTVVTDGWYNQTGDETQGDIQIRLLASNMQRHDYHNKTKPGYDVDFATWVANPENFCAFTFENDPIETDDGHELSAGYGVEARFPLSTYESDAYKLNVAGNNSADFSSDRYAVAMGSAWWMDYSKAAVVYFDYEANVFFGQSEEQLAQKKIVYTDSEYNALYGGKVVGAVAALAADASKEAVQAVVDQYNALDSIQKGYVAYKGSFETLKTHADRFGIELKDIGDDVTPPTPSVTVEDVIAQINALPETITYDHKAAIRKIEAALDKLTEKDLDSISEDVFLKFIDAEFQLDVLLTGDVNDDRKVDAEDALMALKAAVNKLKLTEEQAYYADVNGDEVINAEDALEMLRFAVDKIDHFSIFND